MGVRVYDKASQTEIELSPEQAQLAVRSGEAVLPTDRITIKRGHETATLDPSEFAAAYQQGWDLSDEEEARSLRIRREETDLASSIAGGVEAAASGVSLGATRWIERQLGVDPERMAARAEGLGAAEDFLEIAGSIAPALLTGGGSAAATAAKTAAGMGAKQVAKTAARQALRYSPAGLATRAGAAAEQLAGRALAGRALPGAIKKAIPMAGRGMVEGFAFGAGAEIDEAVLGDRDLIAEQVLASGLMGGALGGAGEILMRQGLPAMLGASRKVGRGAIQKVMGAFDGGEGSKTLAGLYSGALKRGAKASRYLGSPKEVESLAEVLGQRGGAKRIRDVTTNAGDRLDEMATEVGAGLDSLARRTREIGTLASNKAKYTRAERILRSGEYDDIASRVVQNGDGTEIMGLGNAQAHVRRLMELNAEAGGQSFIHADLKKLAGTLDEMFRGMTDDVSAAGAFRAADRAKRAIDSLIEKRGGRGVAKIPGVHPSVVDTVGEMATISGDFRKVLERQDVFGDAALMQQTRNAAISAERAAGKALGRQSSIMRRWEDPTLAIDHSDALSITRSLGKSKDVTKIDRMEAFLEAKIERARVDVEMFDPPGGAAKLKELIDEFDSFKAARASRREDAEIVSWMQKARDVEGMGSPSIHLLTSGAAGLAPVVGLGLGGIPGLVAGGAFGMLARPYTAIRTLAQIAEVADRVGSRSDGAVRRFLESAGSKAKPLAEKVGEVARRAPARYITAKARETKETKRERFDRVRQALAHAGSNPGAVTKRLEGQLAVLDEVAPKLSGLVNDRANKAAAYLLGKMPPVYTPPFSSPSQALVDPMAMDRFMRRVDVAEDPIVALDYLADGSIAREHADTLRDLYPAIYADVQESIVDALADAQARHEPWPMDHRVRVGILFGVQTDPSLAPQAQALIQMAHAPPPEPEGKGAPPRRVKSGRKVEVAKGKATAGGLAEVPLSERYA